jgi:enolase
MKIKSLSAQEILDSRGWPTVECVLFLEDGRAVKASVPSGASVGEHEAVELRDGDLDRYSGKGVLRAIENIEKIIAPEIIGRKIDIFEIDKLLIEIDGTPNKSKLGANAILAVSMAVVRAQALTEGKPLYELISTLNSVSPSIPRIMFNILNGGVHADNGIAFQEFMIMPMGTKSAAETIHMASTVYQSLKKKLKAAGYSVGVGDEGGFAPLLKGGVKQKEREALDFIMGSIESAGFEPGKDLSICLDVAASQFYDKKTGEYLLYGERISTTGMCDLYSKLIDDYPIFSIEDGLDENDWDGWSMLTKRLGSRVQLVGDDIFVSNRERILRGVKQGVGTASLIKPNQVGTVSETLDSIKQSQKNGFKVVVSHRSGETIDSFIADLVVGSDARQIKSGACARGERVVKYNRIMEIEKKLLS